jgi:hypothetical protein
MGVHFFAMGVHCFAMVLHASQWFFMALPCFLLLRNGFHFFGAKKNPFGFGPKGFLKMI